MVKCSVKGEKGAYDVTCDASMNSASVASMPGMTPAAKPNAAKPSNAVKSANAVAKPSNAVAKPSNAVAKPSNAVKSLNAVAKPSNAVKSVNAVAKINGSANAVAKSVNAVAKANGSANAAKSVNAVAKANGSANAVAKAALQKNLINKIPTAKNGLKRVMPMPPPPPQTVMKSSGTSSLAPTGLVAPPLSGKSIGTSMGGRRSKRHSSTRKQATRKA